VSGEETRRPLALTLGEPAGIGPDIAIEAWLARRKADIPPFIFIGDAEVLQRRAAILGREIRTIVTSADRAAELFTEVIPCLEGEPAVSGAPGKIAASDTEAVVRSIRRAAELVHAGEASAVVTNPIQKKALNDAGFAFPGHTEFLGALSEEIFGRRATPVMMLASPKLRVVPVTIHIPLAEVPHKLTTELIVGTAAVVDRDLRTRFGIGKPRIAIAGLNPHAGEDSMLGHEDAAIVRPAVDALVAQGIDATGPLSADTMFHDEARRAYDAALCMYHDQALIPVKTLGFDDAVNVTLGLPFVRTSPDHGTALAIAGAGKARATSLIAALKMADALARRAALE
jgi:4-hydroxythreonine-4-phosphate dehydrogenase